MLHLSIIQAMESIATRYELQPDSPVSRIRIRTGQTSLDDVSELAELIASSLSCCAVASCEADSFVLDWDGFIVTVEFKIGNRGCYSALISMNFDN